MKLCRFFKAKLKFFENAANLSNSILFQELYSNIEINSPFKQYKSVAAQKNLIESHENFLESKEIVLGYRSELQYTSESVFPHEKLIKESFFYIPVINILKKLFKYPEFWLAVNKVNVNHNRVYCSFTDGMLYD